MSAVDYRAPELLYGHTYVTAAIDTWAIACSMGRVARQSGLFRVTLDGAARFEHLDSAEIYDILGFSVRSMSSARASGADPLQ